MPLSKQPFAVAALSAACLLSVPAAYAQNQPQSQIQRQPAAPSISDQKLDATATALEHVASIRRSYQQKIAAAPSSDKERLAGEASKAMTKAVTDQGLSIEEYTSIIQVAQNDPAVRDKLLQRIHPSGE